MWQTRRVARTPSAALSPGAPRPRSRSLGQADKTASLSAAEEGRRAAASTSPRPAPFERTEADDLRWEDKGSPDAPPMVRAASLARLVERVTYEAYADHGLAATVILTHRTFTDSLGLFSLLVARFNLRAPGHLAGPALQKWTEQVQAPVRIRVSNVLRQWVSLCPEDFAAADLSAALIAFVDGPLQGAAPTMAAHLRAFFQKRHDRARCAPRTPPRALPAPRAPRPRSRARS